MPQDPGTLLFAPTVREEVAETLRLLGRTRDEGAIECWLESLGLGAVATRHPRSLSGGERQRVAIARALINEPSLLLADEPTGNLDQHTGASILEMLLAIRARRRLTMLVVTHDERTAARADRVVRLADGLVVDA